MILKAEFRNTFIQYVTRVEYEEFEVNGSPYQSITMAFDNNDWRNLVAHIIAFDTTKLESDALFQIYDPMLVFMLVSTSNLPYANIEGSVEFEVVWDDTNNIVQVNFIENRNLFLDCQKADSVAYEFGDFAIMQKKLSIHQSFENINLSVNDIEAPVLIDE